MKTVISVAIGVLFGLALWELGSVFSPIALTAPNKSTLEISYVDLLSLMLTGVTILLAILGFGVAMLGFFGWRSIGSIASKAGEGVVKDSIKSGGELNEALRDELRALYKYRGMDAINRENGTEDSLDEDEEDYQEDGSKT